MKDPPFIFTESIKTCAKTYHQIRINEVIQALQENGHQTEAAAQAGQRGHDPVDVLGVAGPREPEQADRESNAADDDLGQAPLGHRHVVVGRQLALVARLPEDDEGAGQQLAHDHAEVGQAADAQVHAVDLLEDDGVGREEEVEDAVDEGLKERISGERADDYRIGGDLPCRWRAAARWAR